MTRRPWDHLEIELLRRLYPHVSTARLAQAMGRTDRQVYAQAAAIGVKKSAAYLASPQACRLRRGDNPGAAHRIRPGNRAWNKGMKGLDIGGKATRFKKGERRGAAALNYQPIGAERLSKDGYLQIKITDDPSVPPQRRWAFAHNLIWQSTHGLVPPGCRVRYLNGDRTDLHPDNLGLTTPAEVMARNTLHNLPAPLPQVIQLLGAIKRQVNKREGKHA